MRAQAVDWKEVRVMVQRLGRERRGPRMPRIKEEEGSQEVGSRMGGGPDRGRDSECEGFSSPP